MQAKLEAERKYRGLTQKDMADRLNVDVRTYINKEQGLSQFKAGEMFLIAQLFDMSIEDIFLPSDFIKHEEGA